LPRRSSVLPWDIELLSGLVLAAMPCDGSHTRGIGRASKTFG
jgi:hypothetical protein